MNCERNPKTKGRKMKNQSKTRATVSGRKIKTSMVLLAAAVIAMVTSSAATAGPPSDRRGGAAVLRDHELAVGLKTGGRAKRPKGVARHRQEAPIATLLVRGLQGGSGSTVGPDGALYVT